MQAYTEKKELTPRETEVFRLLACFFENKEIAKILNCSVATVKMHVASILQKLNVTSRAQAVVMGLKKGIINLDDVRVR